MVHYKMLMPNELRRALIAVAAIFLAQPALADPIRPDPKLTPGAWQTPPTPLHVMCAVGYTKTVRDVPDSVKSEVFRRYGYDPRSINRGDYEIDHLVPLSIDGTSWSTLL